MSRADPIGDALTQLRNAIMARLESVDIPYSKLKQGIIKILHERRFIRDYDFIENRKGGVIRVYLKYTQRGESIISGLKRVSKPGRRYYVSADKIPRVLGGLGVGIISTSKGILSDEEARKLRVGGEFICTIW
jgi:small subunit ribosomal protein S8